MTTHDSPGGTPAGPATLIGVGMGPGDPELVTVRAVRVLREADVVLVPAVDTEGGPAAPVPGRAEATVLAHLDPADQGKVRRVGFTMSGQVGVTPRRAAAWEAAAVAVLDAVAAGARTVAFATIGDPNVYSTFSYLAQTVAERHPGTVVRTVPGITALQDLASRAGTPLCEGRETLTLVPLTAGMDIYRAALATGDTVVAYKVGRHLPAVAEALAEAGRLDDAVRGSALGLPEEHVGPLAGTDPDAAPGYLTTVLSPAPRSGRGGRL